MSFLWPNSFKAHEVDKACELGDQFPQITEFMMWSMTYQIIMR